MSSCYGTTQQNTDNVWKKIFICIPEQGTSLAFSNLAFALMKQAVSSLEHRPPAPREEVPTLDDAHLRRCFCYSVIAFPQPTVNVGDGLQMSWCGISCIDWASKTSLIAFIILYIHNIAIQNGESLLSKWGHMDILDVTRSMVTSSTCLYLGTPKHKDFFFSPFFLHGRWNLRVRIQVLHNKEKIHSQDYYITHFRKKNNGSFQSLLLWMTHMNSNCPNCALCDLYGLYAGSSWQPL